MIIYHYHPETRVYLGAGEADPSPMEPGEYLVPAHATTITPPDSRDGYERVFDEGGWQLVMIEPEPVPEPEPELEPEPESTPKTHADLKVELAEIHDRYCSGTTPYGGIEIAIDVEARVNAQGTLAAVQRGQQPLPFAWFNGDQGVTVSSEADMQAIHDAIFAALQKRFAAKAKVLASIDSITDPDSYSVEAAYRAHLR